MRFVIYGAGAVGSVVGGYLTQAGYDVVLIGRPQHVAQVRAAGLLLQNKEGVHTVKVEAVTSLDGITLTEEDRVFLTVKSQDTPTAVTDLARHGPGILPLFCFQNGVRNEEIAAQRFDRVYGVLVMIGGRYLGPGRVVNFTGRSVTIGRYPRGLDALAASVAAVLRRAGLKVTLSEDVMAGKWSKLILNLTNPFHAITDLSLIEARRLPEARAFIADMWEEGLRVLEAAGIDYEDIPGRSSIREQIRQLREGAPEQDLQEDPEGHYRPSTWQDLALQRGSTEVDAFNGEIVRLGARHGIPTPINQLLLGLVEDMADKKELPGKYSIGDLRAMLGAPGRLP